MNSVRRRDVVSTCHAMSGLLRIIVDRAIAIPFYVARSIATCDATSFQVSIPNRVIYTPTHQLLHTIFESVICARNADDVRDGCVCDIVV